MREQVQMVFIWCYFFDLFAFTLSNLIISRNWSSNDDKNLFFSYSSNGKYWHTKTNEETSSPRKSEWWAKSNRWNRRNAPSSKQSKTEERWDEITSNANETIQQSSTNQLIRRTSSKVVLVSVIFNSEVDQFICNMSIRNFTAQIRKMHNHLSTLQKWWFRIKVSHALQQKQILEHRYQRKNFLATKVWMMSQIVLVKHWRAIWQNLIKCHQHKSKVSI